MARIVFEKVSIRRTKKGKCRCGKMRTRSKEFWQTISPFNIHKGRQKSIQQIQVENEADARTWEKEPITCDACSHTN